jgi:hypothetical protein
LGRDCNAHSEHEKKASDENRRNQHLDEFHERIEGTGLESSPTGDDSIGLEPLELTGMFAATMPAFAAALSEIGLLAMPRIREAGR